MNIAVGTLTFDGAECQKCHARMWPSTQLDAHMERHRVTEAYIAKQSHNIKVMFDSMRDDFKRVTGVEEYALQVPGRSQ